MTNEVNGRIEALTRDNKRMFIDGTWYSSFNPLKCRKGDTVSFKFKENIVGDRTFYNVTGSVKVSEDAPSDASPTNSAGKGGMTGHLHPILSRERLIIRQNALTNAVAFTSGSASNIEEVLEIASAFERYTSGDDLKDALAEATKTFLADN